MAEFRTEYYTPMDRGYHGPNEILPAANIEQPIIPLGRLGQTVPEHDPSGRFKNILQNVQAAIRGGTGNLQIVFQTPIESAIGGRPKAYGEEVRTAIREVAMAGGVQVTGMEMPTSLTNLSGLDMQRGIVDEEKRQRDLDEVKEMVRFAAEVGQGGGVDIVSWEFDRPVHRAKWMDKDAVAQKAFSRAIADEKHKEEIRFVDTRSGAIGSIPIRDGIPMFMDKKSFKPIDSIKGTPELWDYDDFARYAKTKGMTAEEAIKKNFLEEQANAAKAQSAYYTERYDDANNAREQLSKQIKQLREEGASESKLKDAADRLKQVNELADSFRVGIEGQKRIELQNEERIKNWKLLEDETVKRSQASYAEAGIAAMQMQDNSKLPIKKDLYVGPEIGWPQYYGSHPTEFVGMILGAREQMKQQLVAKGFTPDRAASEAKRHIKGTFDTGHLGMWLQQFHPEMPWDERRKKFDKWYTEQVEYLADQNKKHDIIGAIQVVDSAGAGHGHLPAGQGILPVKKAVEILQQKGGFKGYIASEGHEEEKFGEGRITLKTWQAFNAPLSGGYHGGGGGSMPPRRWGEVQHGYFGKTYSPFFMFGAYAPSNEFKLWSEVPLE